MVADLRARLAAVEAVQVQHTGALDHQGQVLETHGAVLLRVARRQDRLEGQVEALKSYLPGEEERRPGEPARPGQGEGHLPGRGEGPEQLAG